MANLKTTLGEMLDHGPCGFTAGGGEVWDKLTTGLGTADTDESVTLLQILDINGVKDAFWALRCWSYRDYCLLLADVIESAVAGHRCSAVSNMPETIRMWHIGAIDDNDFRAAAYAAADAAYDAAAYAAAYDDYADAAAAYAAYAAYDAYDAAAYAAYAAYDAAAAADAARSNSWDKSERLMRDFIASKEQK